MIIYTHNSEILIVANAYNVDYFVSMSAYSQKIPFQNAILAVTLITARIKLCGINSQRSVPLPKRYATYRIAKTKYKLLSTDNFCHALDVIGRLVEQSTI